MGGKICNLWYLMDNKAISYRRDMDNNLVSYVLASCGYLFWDYWCDIGTILFGL